MALLRALLWLCHWLLLCYACALIARAILDWYQVEYPEKRDRTLAIENVLSLLTEPVLQPIRKALRPFIPSEMDASPVVAVILCAGVACVLVLLSGMLQP